MLQSTPPLSALALALLIATAPAQADPQKAPSTKQADPVQEINQLLDKIQKAMKTSVSPAQVAARLRARTPSYRVVRLKKAPKGAPAAAAAIEPQPAASQPSGPKSRLLGDAEKAKLAKGTVLVVDGLGVTGKEIQDLAAYFASYTKDSEQDNTARAISELIKVKTVQAAFKDKLPALRKKIDEYRKLAIADGADFSKVASEHSQCPSAASGGDLGKFTRDLMVPPFSRWAFSLPVGKISPVFATHFGFHFLKVTAKEKGKTPAESVAQARHVLVLYTEDQGKIGELELRAQTGKANVGVIDEAWRAKLPKQYR